MSTKRNSHLADQYLRKITLTCHPRAERAWQSWNKLIRQFTPSILPIETLILIQKFDPIHVIKNTSKNQHQFIAGFPSVALIKSTQFKQAAFIIHNKLSPEEIELISWIQVFKTLIYDMDNASGLASFYDAVNQNIPGRICRILIKHKRLTRPWLSNICGVTENALRWQLTKIGKPPTCNKSIIDRILED